MRADTWRAWPGRLAWLAIGLSLGCHSVPRYRGIDPSTGHAVAFDGRAPTSTDTLAGRYVSPQLGRLELAERDGVLSGHYAYGIGGCPIEGTLEGHFERARGVARFTFRERGCGADGTVKLSGRGFLLFEGAQGTRGRVRLFGQRSFDARLHNRGAARVQVGHAALQATRVVAPSGNTAAPAPQGPAPEEAP